MQKIILAAAASLLVTACSSIAMPTQSQPHALALHNTLRSKHHAPAMQWDENLARYAARHAAQCEFRHSDGRYGENIAAGFSTTAEAIQAWYNEKNVYSYEHPGFSKKTGHFTQMVWKSSTKLGCAKAVCNGANGTPGEFLVCEYSPAGNIVNAGYFARNVVGDSV